MTNDSIASLTDSDLLIETARAASVERRSTADLLVLLAEVDVRKLYLARGYSSLFVYCTQSLHLSEAAAYARITAARASRSFPDILPNLTNGSVTLTTISLLAAHLTDENHEALLHAARDKSRREVERTRRLARACSGHCVDPPPIAWPTRLSRRANADTTGRASDGADVGTCGAAGASPPVVTVTGEPTHRRAARRRPISPPSDARYRGPPETRACSRVAPTSDPER